MRMSDLTTAAPGFRSRLREARQTITDVSWYPYSSLDNVSVLEQFLPANVELAPTGGSVLDVGAGDGDMGYLFQSLGCEVNFLDNAPTNFNDCEGIRRTATILGRPASLI